MRAVMNRSGAAAGEFCEYFRGAWNRRDLHGVFFIERKADEVVYNLLFQAEALIEVVAEHVLLGKMSESVLLVGEPDEYGHRVGYHPVNIEGEQARIYQAGARCSHLYSSVRQAKAG